MTELIVEYCPLCGGKLRMAKWQHGPRVMTKICPQNHLLDIWDDHVALVSLSQCKCGEVMPTRDMRDIDKQRVCPKCFAVAKKAWRMDREKSYARLDITPIKTADRRYYDFQTSIKIEPYPNPFMFGGMWGGSHAIDEQELEAAIKSFNETTAKLKENGMEKVDVIRHDESIRTEQVGMGALGATNKRVAPVRTATPAASKPAAAKTKEPAQRGFF